MAKELGILFDLDGTLWDSSQAVVDSWNEALDKYPEVTVKITVEMMQGYMGKTMEFIANDYFGRVNGLKGDSFQDYLDVCVKYENEYIEEHGGILFDGLEETLKTLREQGFFMAVVSNCQIGYIEAFLKHHGLEQYFDDTENYGRTLQDKDVNIRLVIDRNHLKKTVYVGDIMGDYLSTMKAAEQVEGPLTFIHAAYGFGNVPEGTAAIADIRELPAKVREILG